MSFPGYNLLIAALLCSNHEGTSTRCVSAGEQEEEKEVEEVEEGNIEGEVVEEIEEEE